jgi:hypothetical protein
VLILYQCINMHEHVTSVCRAAYYHLKDIHCLKAFLTEETIVTVVHAFVTSRIDYCDFLLYSISDYNINCVHVSIRDQNWIYFRVIPDEVHTYQQEEADVICFKTEEHFLCL